MHLWLAKDKQMCSLPVSLAAEAKTHTFIQRSESSSAYAVCDLIQLKQQLKLGKIGDEQGEVGWDGR